MSWEDWEKSADKGPGSITLRVILFILGCIVLITLIGIPLGWFNEASTVARQEFGPKAALQKYEWFVDQAERINKMEQDVALFEKRLSDVEVSYAGYGSNRAQWPPDVRVQYNHARQNASDDLVAIKSQRNSLVQEYNAQSEKFNWQPFLTRDDKPREKFEVYEL
jgi:hypothetical protein